MVFTNADPRTQTVTFPSLTLSSPPIAPGGTWTQQFGGRDGNHLFRQMGAGNFQGRVVVNVAGTVGLTSAPQAVVYGGRVVLRGSSPYPGTQVAIEHRPTGATQWSEAIQTPAAEDGTYSAVVVPTIGTRYRAAVAAGQLRSLTVNVGVRPRLSVRVTPRRAPAGRRALVRVTVSPAPAIRRVELEAYDSRRRRWSGVGSRPVAKGVAVFRWQIRPGTTRLRVFVRRPDVRPGYDVTESAPISVTGT